MIYLYTFFISLVLTLVFTPLVRKFAIKHNFFDNPTNSIKTHKKPIPYLGGLAISMSFFITLTIIRFATSFETGTLRNLRGIFLAGFLILIIGIIDDLRDMNFKFKFFWQFVAATILIYFDMRIKFIQPTYLAIIFSYLWIIGLINAVNLIDIMDGLSSGIVFIASMTFFFINSPYEASYVNFAAIAIAGASLGFLKYNWTPAKIFMGDAGSMFIGLVIASISLGANYSVNNKIGVLTPIIILIVPIYDTFYIMYKRIRKGRSIFLGSKDHVALRLHINGWSRKQTVVVLYLAGICAGIISYLITCVGILNAVMLYLLIVIFSLIIGKKLGEIEVD
ncbi:glycosyltransferase family 4 protein [bacterium]